MVRFVLSQTNIFPLRLLYRSNPFTPSSTASAERSFSSLRRLKICMGSTMTENHLCGLALTAMNRDKVSLDDAPIILDRYAAQKAQRLNIILWSSSYYRPSLGRFHWCYYPLPHRNNWLILLLKNYSVNVFHIYSTSQFIMDFFEKSDQLKYLKNCIVLSAKKSRNVISFIS